MPDQKFINIDVISIIHEFDHFKVTATLENASPQRNVVAYWFTHTDEPQNVRYKSSFGVVFLSRKKKTIHFHMLFNSQPIDPVIQLGAALITNPPLNDPSKPHGTGVAAFNVNKRMKYLQTNGAD